MDHQDVECVYPDAEYERESACVCEREKELFKAACK